MQHASKRASKTLACERQQHAATLSKRVNILAPILQLSFFLLACPSVLSCWAVMPTLPSELASMYESGAHPLSMTHDSSMPRPSQTNADWARPIIWPGLAVGEMFSIAISSVSKRFYKEIWAPIQKVIKPLENPLEISYTGKSTKMGSLDMSHNQIEISSGFSSSCLTY